MKNQKSTVDKYAIAHEFKNGIVDCLRGSPIINSNSQAWHDGYAFAFEKIRPKINEVTNDYVVKLGYKPFSIIEALRK